MKRFDPLMIDTDLPLTGTYYPVGFPLHIATNSRDVLEAAEESWSDYSQEFDSQAIELRIVVQTEGALCGIPVHRALGNLYSVVFDRHNFAMLDTRALSGAMFVSQATAREHVWLRWFFVESLAYSLLCQRYVAPVHSACVARGGVGIMLCGPTGAGKSTLAYACARAGWTYVSDDCVFLLADSSNCTAIGRCRQIRFRPDAPQLFPELEGFLARTRPNGKLAIEVPTAALPEIRTAPRVSAGGILFLERRSGAAPGIEPIGAEEALERLLADMPSYGPEVNEMHEREVRKLVRIRAFRMHYETIEDGVELLRGIVL